MGRAKGTGSCRGTDGTMAQLLPQGSECVHSSQTQRHPQTSSYETTVSKHTQTHGHVTGEDRSGGRWRQHRYADVRVGRERGTHDFSASPGGMVCYPIGCFSGASTSRSGQPPAGGRGSLPGGCTSVLCLLRLGGIGSDEGLRLRFLIPGAPGLLTETTLAPAT